jgi:hypothetical protein
MTDILETNILLSSQAYPHIATFASVVIVIFLLIAIKETLTDTYITFEKDCDERIVFKKLQ